MKRTIFCVFAFMVPAAAQARAVLPIEQPPAQMAEVATLEVSVAAGGRALLADTIRIARGQSANIGQTRSEASVLACPDAQGLGRTTTDNTSIRLELSAYDRSNPDRFTLNFNWTRPGAGGCERQGTQTVGLSQTIMLPLNGKLDVEGDGGLVLRFRRTS